MSSNKHRQYNPNKLLIYYRSWRDIANNCYRLTLLTAHDRIVEMKFVSALLEQLGIKKVSHKTLAMYKEELLFQEGRKQFQKLLQFGLKIPVQAL